ncbi:hypothetical protein ACM66B_002324 [Microbotryomycetes sp. NB124-2]
MDGAPYAKRQKVTSTSRVNLNPEPLRQPLLYQPGVDLDDDSNVSSTRGVSSTARKHSSTTAAGTNRQSSLKEYPHGNFQGYYTRRKLETTTTIAAESSSAAHQQDDELDPRLQLVPREWFNGKRVLDVGCNAGKVSIQVAQMLSPQHVTAVDIDDDLVKIASRQAELAWSRQQPLDYITGASAHYDDTEQLLDLPTTSVSDSETGSSRHNSTSYFPLSMPRMFGLLPVPKELLTLYVDQPQVEVVSQATGRKGKRKVMPLEQKQFPLNLEFHNVDWVNDEFEPDRRGYHVILALSVTKWIHLNGLNKGLFEFFRRTYETLLPGGVLILEPQLWSTYAKSVKANPSLRSNYDKLKSSDDDDGEAKEGRGWKAEAGDFERVLLKEIGFDSVKKLGETGDKGFKRPVLAFFKRDGSWL